MIEIGRSALVEALRRLIKDIDKELVRLGKQRTRLEAAMLEAASDHQALTALGAEFAEVTAAHDAAEERWLELADELERATS